MAFLRLQLVDDQGQVHYEVPDNLTERILTARTTVDVVQVARELYPLLVTAEHRAQAEFDVTTRRVSYVTKPDADG